MALRVRPEILERYGAFYNFALGDAAPEGCVCIRLEGADDATLADAVRANPAARAVSVRGKGLTTLAPLDRLPELTWVRAYGCPRLGALWCMEATPALRGVALERCKNLRSIPELAGAVGLEHLYLQYGAWDAVVLDSLAPLRALAQLRTLDLGCKGVRGGDKLSFNTLYPHLEALTITPGLRKAFCTAAEEQSL